MSVEAFGGDGSGVEEGRHDADGRIVLAGEMERRPLAPPAGRRGGIPGLLAGVGLFGEQVDCLAPPGLVAELLICSTLPNITRGMYAYSIEHCRQDVMYVPLRRDKRQTQRYEPAHDVLGKDSICTGKIYGPRHGQSSELSTNEIWGEGANNYRYNMLTLWMPRSMVEKQAQQEKRR